MGVISVKGIDVVQKNQPQLDPGFVSITAFSKSFLESAKDGVPVVLALKRDGGQVSRYDTKVHGTADKFDADLLYIEKTVKMLLWAAGGYEVYICGGDAVKKIAYETAKIYAAGGAHEFDNEFMTRVYENKFSVIYKPLDEAPAEVSSPKPIGGNDKGCRIGFDAGGSDRKVSAVVDGEAVYDEEVLWLPKENTDPEYHYNEILTAFRTAAGKMPRVDAIGVSSAGIYVDNRTAVASLFNKVPLDLFNAKVKDIYIRAAKAIADEQGKDSLPLVVANDGDVSALAGALSLGDGEVLGIAMGTSEAVGYVNQDKYVTGWLNELSFAPFDLGKDATYDEWSGDNGTGNKYFSQDAVIKLAPKVGFEFPEGLTLAKKLKFVQNLTENGTDEEKEKGAAIYRTIGAYFAHAVAYYAEFYEVRHILLLGRVMSGRGGDILLETTKQVLADEYPDVNKNISLDLPDEKFRRLGQSVVASTL
ncbi:MAG: ROK family protein [Oscillospiraceae bacterium]|jgi:predicted NBD/HSP70 family sugar kinase|nr:ROK family protein [Oscillospiraceae bacterium]